jgi:hypothetical protein
MVDTPTNNFCTWNPLAMGSNNLLKEGNLYWYWNGTGNWHYHNKGTYSVDSGKYYWEILKKTGRTDSEAVGIASDQTRPSQDGGQLTHNQETSGTYAYEIGGKKFKNGVDGGAYGNTWSTGDIIGVALDLDNGTITFYHNGTSQGTAYSDLSTNTYGGWSPAISGYGGSPTSEFVANFGQDSSFAGNDTTTAGPYTDGGGIGDFYYTPPSGFLALCTKNLPDPAVIPSEHFNTVLWTGDSNTPRDITGVGFQPDFVWTKTRSQANDHSLFDAIRGASRRLASNNTKAEYNPAAYGDVSAFLSDGFTADNGTGGSLADEHINESGENYVAWNWKAGNATLGTGDFTQGSIASTCSRNVDAGFSIVSYTGSGANATVGHGLASTPEMVIVKNRNYVSNWPVLHSGTASDYETDYIPLNNATTAFDNVAYWNDTKPTNSLFSVGTDNDVNRSGNAHIAYCFHSVDGYSKVGSFEGNASTSGNFIYTGFTPALVILHNIDDGGGWPMMDNARGDYNSAEAGGGHELLRTNTSGIEGDSGRVDLLSNGFRPTVNYGEMNAAFTYVYIAFAESPFKHTNAR